MFISKLKGSLEIEYLFDRKSSNYDDKVVFKFTNLKK